MANAMLGAALLTLLTPAMTIGGPACAAAPLQDEGTQRIVFHVNEAGESYWESILGNIENLRQELGPANTEVEVVAHGEGLGLVMTTNSALAGRMKALAEQGVVFDACQNTMRKKDVSKAQLLPFATTVDSGVARVVRLQAQGWAYVKP